MIYAEYESRPVERCQVCSVYEATITPDIGFMTLALCWMCLGRLRAELKDAFKAAIFRGPQLVQFNDVGRSKKSWRATVKWDETALEREVKLFGSLGSRGITCSISGETGLVFAGMRPVGAFYIVHDELTP